MLFSVRLTETFSSPKRKVGDSNSLWRATASLANLLPSFVLFFNMIVNHLTIYCKN